MKLQSGLILLKEVLDDLPSAEKQIARYIIENPRKTLELNITQLAKESGSSIEGVVRLCKHIGMKGFRELRLRVPWDISRETSEKKLSVIGKLQRILFLMKFLKS